MGFNSGFKGLRVLQLNKFYCCFCKLTNKDTVSAETSQWSVLLKLQHTSALEGQLSRSHNSHSHMNIHEYI